MIYINLWIVWGQSRMIDIIIPAYNAHETINRAIDSILTQTYQNWHITIVNDGGKPYNINNVDSLTELRYDENKGPGYARNYGIEHTNCEYIMFMDADDMLWDENSLMILNDHMLSSERNVMVISGIGEQLKNDDVILKIDNSSFTHGKLYKRDYLNKYNIRFNNSSCCEDVGFNYICYMLRTSYEKFVEINDVTYFWRYNTNSLGRNDVVTWEYCTTFKGYIDNIIYAFNFVDNYGVNTISKKAINMFKLIYRYDKTMEKHSEFNRINSEALLRYYKEIYKPIKGKVGNKLIDSVMDMLKLPIEYKQRFLQILSLLDSYSK